MQGVLQQGGQLMPFSPPPHLNLEYVIALIVAAGFIDRQGNEQGSFGCPYHI
jgi:hypothetical protein